MPGFVAEQNGTIASCEQRGLLTGCGDGDCACVGSQSAVVEFGKFTDAVADAGTDSQRPEHTAWAKLNILRASRSLKALHVLFSSPCKEKEFVKVTLPREFRFAQWQIRILSQLAWRKRAQRHNGYACLDSQGLQRLRGSRLLLGDRQTGKPSQADGRCTAGLGVGCVWPQVKIVFREEDPAAVFSDKRVIVGEFTAGIIHLEASAAGDQHGRDAVVIQGGCEFVESGNHLPPSGNQVIDGDVQDEGSLMQTVLRCSRFHLSGD